MCNLSSQCVIQKSSKCVVFKLHFYTLVGFPPQKHIGACVVRHAPRVRAPRPGLPGTSNWRGSARPTGHTAAHLSP